MPKCSHEDSRLTCVDCSAAICSNCLVQCPVGFRCKSCVGGPAPAAKPSSSLGAAKTLGVCAVVGFGCSYVMQFLNLIPFLGCIIAYFLGSFIGRGLDRIVDQNLHGKLAMTVAFGLLIGLSLGAYREMPAAVSSMFSGAFAAGGRGVFDVLFLLLGDIFMPAAFIAGVLRACVYKTWY